MTNYEIRTTIDKNNEEIQRLLDPARFILNSKVRDLLEANVKLQSECAHEYRNGKCIYCDKEEE